MSESTLSITYDDLRKVIRAFLGLPVNGSEQDPAVETYLQSGVRQFYYPHAVAGVDPNFEWSFLKPSTTLDTVEDTEDYDLPDDCARVLDKLYYDSEYHYPPIKLVSEAELMLRRESTESTGIPFIAAVRHKTSDQTDGQRLELMLYPTPSGAMTLHYRYEAYSGKLTTTKEYPLGGMKHSELLIESCLAIAEQRANDERGLHTERFEKMLIAAAKRDGHNGAICYGNMGEHNGAFTSDSFNRSNGTVTYNDEAID